MKKLILLLFVILIVPSIGYSEDRVISKFIVRDNANYSVRVLCINGHKFVNTNNVQFRKTISNSIVQMFEERDGKSLPAKC